MRERPPRKAADIRRFQFQVAQLESLAQLLNCNQFSVLAILMGFAIGKMTPQRGRRLPGAFAAQDRDAARGVNSKLDDPAAHAQHLHNNITNQNFFIGPTAEYEHGSVQSSLRELKDLNITRTPAAKLLVPCHDRPFLPKFPGDTEPMGENTYFLMVLHRRIEAIRAGIFQ